MRALKRSHTALFVAVVASSLASPRADACVLPQRDLYTVALPFDGATVPTNAELRSPSLDAFNDQPMKLTAPDGAVVDAHWVADGNSARLEIEGASDGLAVGHWATVANDAAGTRVFGFDVADVEDVDAPAAPVLRASREESSLGCGSGASNLLLSFDEAAATDDVALLIVQPGDLRLAVTDGVGSIETYDEIADELTVTAIDHAGNRSAPTTVEVIDMTASGCASVPAAPASALGLALLFIRRRRSGRAAR